MSSCERVGDAASPTRSTSPAATPPQPRLGSVPASLLPLSTSAPPLLTPVGSLGCPAVPSMAGTWATGDPSANLHPPCAVSLPASTGVSDCDASMQAPSPAPGTAGVLYRSPGVAFLDSILSTFHSMVHCAVGGSCELSRFWITPASLSPRFNSFCVANALNFHFTAWPDRFVVSDHGGAIFSAYAATFPVKEFILARRSISLGRSVYVLHRSAGDAAAVVSRLPSWPPYWELVPFDVAPRVFPVEDDESSSTSPAADVASLVAPPVDLDRLHAEVADHPCPVVHVDAGPLGVLMGPPPFWASPPFPRNLARTAHAAHPSPTSSPCPPSLIVVAPRILQLTPFPGASALALLTEAHLSTPDRASVPSPLRMPRSPPLLRAGVCSGYPQRSLAQRILAHPLPPRRPTAPPPLRAPIRTCCSPLRPGNPPLLQPDLFSLRSRAGAFASGVSRRNTGLETTGVKAVRQGRPLAERM
jgi:hypothetical protein